MNETICDRVCDKESPFSHRQPWKCAHSLLEDKKHQQMQRQRSNASRAHKLSKLDKFAKNSLVSRHLDFAFKLRCDNVHQKEQIPPFCHPQ